jgi:hypothetical protein
MSDEVASLLRRIIERLAKTDIKDGPAAQVRKRYTNASDVIAVLCDCSGSMTDLVGSSGISKFHHLQIALEDLQHGFPKIRLIAFGSTAKEFKTAKEIPDPHRTAPLGHGTNLTAALEMAARLKPRKTIIISDGLPDESQGPIDIADTMTGSIEAIYCGPDGHPALAFLRSLCHSTGGSAVAWDGRGEISGVIRLMLPAPEASTHGSRP